MYQGQETVMLTTLIQNNAHLTEANQALSALAAISSSTASDQLEAADADAAIKSFEAASDKADLEHALDTALLANEKIKAEATLAALKAAAQEVGYQAKINELSALVAALKPKAAGHNTNAAIKVGMFHHSATPSESVSDPSEPLSAPAA
jgi:hypothetical protein